MKIGDWYDRLVAIERSLRKQNLVSGRTIFNVSVIL